jgi:FkbM family methyltransferase
VNALRAAKVGEEVIAIEPNPESFAILMKNIKDNNFHNMTAYNTALWSTEEELILQLDQGSPTIYHDSNERPKVKVKAVPLDKLKLKKINILKIEVEGKEVEVLKGGTQTLNRVDKIIIEVRERTKDTVDNILKDYKFKLKKSLHLPAIRNI